VREEKYRLLDMLEAIERIEKYAVRGRAAFNADELIQNWIVHHLQVIGEAARTLSPTLRELHPQVPWTEIIGMRTILVHRYFDIDLDIVWAVVERDLPPLKSWLQSQVGDAQ
jgi:uncharacterized protein with HEPN domain